MANTINHTGGYTTITIVTIESTTTVYPRDSRMQNLYNNTVVNDSQHIDSMMVMASSPEPSSSESHFIESINAERSPEPTPAQEGETTVLNRQKPEHQPLVKNGVPRAPRQPPQQVVGIQTIFLTNTASPKQPQNPSFPAQTNNPVLQQTKVAPTVVIQIGNSSQEIPSHIPLSLSLLSFSKGQENHSFTATPAGVLVGTSKEHIVQPQTNRSLPASSLPFTSSSNASQTLVQNRSPTQNATTLSTPSSLTSLTKQAAPSSSAVPPNLTSMTTAKAAAASSVSTREAFTPSTTHLSIPVASPQLTSAQETSTVLHLIFSYPAASQGSALLATLGLNNLPTQQQMAYGTTGQARLSYLMPPASASASALLRTGSNSELNIVPVEKSLERSTGPIVAKSSRSEDKRQEDEQEGQKPSAEELLLEFLKKVPNFHKHPGFYSFFAALTLPKETRVISAHEKTIEIILPADFSFGNFYFHSHLVLTRNERGIECETACIEFMNQPVLFCAFLEEGALEIATANQLHMVHLDTNL